MTILGDPGTILRFDDLLNGLTKLREAILFMIMVYSSERIQIKVSKEKRCIGQSPGEQAQTSSCVLPVELYRSGLNLLAVMCDNTYEVLPTRKVH